VSIPQPKLFPYDKLHQIFDSLINPFKNAITLPLSISMKFKRIIYFYILFFTGVVLAFGFGYLIRAIQDLSGASEFPTLEQAYDILANHAYYDLPTSPTLEYGMIRGMVDSFGDPFTRFEEPVQHELSSNQLEGKFGGIGANLEQDPEGNVILHPFSNGPAKDAGVLDGDHLIKVDDLKITEIMSLDEVIAAIRGLEGDPVTIEIFRPTNMEVLSFTIIRQDIPLPSVSWHLNIVESRLGIIQVNIIAATTVNEIQNAIADLTSRGATHFALDLRGNRGGLLTAGIEIARLFLEDGPVIQEHYRGQDEKTYVVETPGPFVTVPLVVLVNSDTASAAEIIAGALKSHKRAIIIGNQTYGKDSIQLVFDLQDGSSLHVTAAKWWIPGIDSPIGEEGIEPDVWVTPVEGEADPYVNAAIQILFGYP